MEMNNIFLEFTSTLDQPFFLGRLFNLLKKYHEVTTLISFKY